MKVIAGILVIVIVAVTAVLWIQPFDKEPEDAVYVYYPKKNIYFNADTRNYIGFDSASNTWKKIKPISTNDQAALGKSVTLGKFNDTNVWRNNDQHRLIYGTSLYTSGDEVKKKYLEDSIRSLPPKPPAPVAKKEDQEAEAEKKRSGFRKFMDKIFKKKEKKN